MIPNGEQVPINNSPIYILIERHTFFRFLFAFAYWLEEEKWIFFTFFYEFTI